MLIRRASPNCFCLQSNFDALRYWSLLIAETFSSLPCLLLENFIWGKSLFLIPYEQVAILLILYQFNDKLVAVMLFMISRFVKWFFKLSSVNGLYFSLKHL